MEGLRCQLEEARQQGNQAYKVGEDARALKLYSVGIDEARRAGAVDLDGCPARGDAVQQLVATLYANRAAAALRLLRFEQVVRDASRAVTLLVVKGSSDIDRCVLPEVRSLYGKALVRRGTALEALGNFMQASIDLSRGGEHAGDAAAERRAGLLYDALSHPIRYGHTIPEATPPAMLPPAPPRRSSANVDGAMQKKLKCRLPTTCLFMQCAAWEGKIYVWGGSTTEPIGAEMGDQLAVVDPKQQAITLLEVKSDPDSWRRYGLPGKPAKRARHTMVLFQGALYIYGGELEERSSTGLEPNADEARTVWRLDLSAQPLTWQRIYCRGAVPAQRRNHSAAVWQSQMVVYGGETMENMRDIGDVFSFDLMHHKWRQLAPSPPPRTVGMAAAVPEPRRECASWVQGDWFYVFGGMSNSVESARPEIRQRHRFNAAALPSMWRFHLGQHRWERVHFIGNFPAARGEMAVAVSPRGAVYLAGGYSTAVATIVRPDNHSGQHYVQQSAYSAELFEFCCATATFRRVLAPDMQPALGDLRAGATACWLDGQVHVLGGYVSFMMPLAQRTIVSIDMRVCAHCGVRRTAAPGAKLSQCARCKEEGRPPVYYCSEQCMAQNW
ncbi:hypothetical protein ABPG75_002350 [Micractinium tetrahymenae]